VLGHEVVQSIAGERLASRSREDRVGGVAAALCEPGSHDSDRAGREGRGSVLATLAQGVDMRSRAEVEVLDPQRGELGCSQAGLGGEEQ
jgi:hypothetical protein